MFVQKRWNWPCSPSNLTDPFRILKLPNLSIDGCWGFKIVIGSVRLLLIPAGSSYLGLKQSCSADLGGSFAECWNECQVSRRNFQAWIRSHLCSSSVSATSMHRNERERIRLGSLITTWKEHQFSFAQSDLTKAECWAEVSKGVFQCPPDSALNGLVGANGRQIIKTYVKPLECEYVFNYPCHNWHNVYWFIWSSAYHLLVVLSPWFPALSILGIRNISIPPSHTYV